MTLFQKKSITAKLVGPNLVASFPSANPPLIWKFDLDRNHSFTIGMQGEEGDWELGITSPKGEFYPVAHFPAQEDAEEAMAKVQKVLMKKRRSKIWTFIKYIVLLIFLVALAMVGYAYYTLPASSRPSLTQIPQGVPVPADDVLKAPPPDVFEQEMAVLLGLRRLLTKR